MISQTSLPSQTGPIEANMACRSASSRPRIGRSIPTPKSKPSVTKYADHSTHSNTNQVISRFMSVARYRCHGGGGLVAHLRRVKAGVAAHQDEIHDPERHIQRDEYRK